ncbi:hypothetical protein G6514_008019 [Epicoccum nigrum]|nr:hypothetical protein G6514_008019 [Epicoccum nigrum]
MFDTQVNADQSARFFLLRKEREHKEAAKQQQSQFLTTAGDKKGKDKAASTAAITLRPAESQAQTTTGKKKRASCSECGVYHQDGCQSLSVSGVTSITGLSGHAQTGWKSWLRESAMLDHVGDAAALQQAINHMADKEDQPQQEYANRAEVLAAMIRQATTGGAAALQQTVNQMADDDSNRRKKRKL